MMLQRVSVLAGDATAVIMVQRVMPRTRRVSVQLLIYEYDTITVQSGRFNAVVSVAFMQYIYMEDV